MAIFTSIYYACNRIGHSRIYRVASHGLAIKKTTKEIIKKIIMRPGYLQKTSSNKQLSIVPGRVFSRR